jgi:GT2 family glycosyltransferase
MATTTTKLSFPDRIISTVVHNVTYSAVVPTVGDRGTLQRTLDAIRTQTRPPEETIVVLAHGGVVDVGDDVRVIESEPSSSGQRNAGARAAGAPIVLFVDDDIVLESDFCAELCAVWERRGPDRLAGVVGTIVNETDGPHFHNALRAAAGLGHEAVRARGSRLMASGHVAIVPRPQSEQEVQFATTQCASYRRDLVLQHPFDEEFSGYVYGEDLDLAARLSRIAPIVHTPKARCRHEPISAGIGSGEQNAYRRARIFALFRGRHRRPGLIGALAWEYANATESLILAARAARSRDVAPLREYLRALTETRRQLREERRRQSGGTGRDP